MNGRRIVLVGNMGYVGPVLASHLRARWPDAELVGIDPGWFAHCLTGAPHPERVLDRQLFLDARDLTSDHLRGANAVVQLAAVSNDPMGASFEAVTTAINQQTALRTAELAREAGVSHFVFASSCSVYGFAADGRPRSETDPVDPLTAYARSKIGTESGLAEIADSDLIVTCLRFATACGMSPRLRLDLVLNDFVAAALATGRITVLSDGTPWRPLIDVQDMARAIAWAIERPIGNGGSHLVLNAGSDDWNHQVADLARAVSDATGAEVSINDAAPPDRRSYRVSFARFAELAPDHQPRVTLAHSVRGLIDGLQNLGFSDPDFRDSEQIRLNVLRKFVADGRMTEDLRWSNAL